MSINPYFLLFEGMIYVLFALVVYHASQGGRFQILELLWAALYGFVLEWLTIKHLHAYAYGKFLIMFDQAPLCIALGWALVIYSSRRFSDQLRLPEPVRPVVDALMGLSIDLALDVVAIRLGMWSWTGVRFDQQWFGVPWANFGAWFIVIWSYSGFIRALRVWQKRRWCQWIYPPVAVFLSLLALTAASAVYHVMSDNIDGGAIGPLLLVGGSLLVIVNSHPQIDRVQLPESIVFAVPLAFHGFALFAGVGYGIFTRQPLLGAIELVILAAGTGIHLLPVWISRLRWQQLET
ncbi:MAG TPA: carotenoid biosynthesis protein [Aggregatilineales bacterium]|nr:carotenoid biosynthesis protein [Aggregatilineales bacterium]